MSMQLTDKTFSSTDPATTDPALTGPGLTEPASTTQAQERVYPSRGSAGGVPGVEKPFPWQVLHMIPTRQLRVMCNKTFKAMDNDFPPADATDQYAALVEEIRARETQVQTPGEGRGNDENLAFRDDPMARRFELFVDGILAGYVKYQMHGGQVILLETVITADFSSHDCGIEETLIRRIFLNAHQRRLAMRAHCGRVRSFLAEYPQYRSLVPATARHAAIRIT